MAGTGHIAFGMRLHIADLGQAGENALAVDVAQAPFDVIFLEQGGIHLAAG